jgi:hypothetical protein
MANVIDTVSREVMIEDGCGMTEQNTGERVLCDDARLFEARESKCNCRSSAKAAIRATLEWYRANISEGMQCEAKEAPSGVDWLHGFIKAYEAALSQAIKELDEETV